MQALFRRACPAIMCNRADSHQRGTPSLSRALLSTRGASAKESAAKTISNVLRPEGGALVADPVQAGLDEARGLCGWRASGPIARGAQGDLFLQQVI